MSGFRAYRLPLKEFVPGGLLILTKYLLGLSFVVVGSACRLLLVVQGGDKGGERESGSEG